MSSQSSWVFIIKITVIRAGPWWWSSGQRARLLPRPKIWVLIPLTLVVHSVKFVFVRSEKRGRGWPIFNNTLKSIFVFKHFRSIMAAPQPFFKKWPHSVSFCLFQLFWDDEYSANIINDKSIDGVLGTRTRGGRMAGAVESTELYGGTPLLNEVKTSQ